MATQATTSRNPNTVVGVFHSHAEAQRAVRELTAAGFTEDQIGIASQDQQGSDPQQAEGNKAGESIAAGAATGVGAGALWGLGIVAGVLPALGPVIAGGALAAVVASAAATGVAGGLVGALVGLGIPEDEASYYQREFEQGRAVVTVNAADAQAAEAAAILDRSNAYDYRRRESDYATNPNAEKRVNANGNLVVREEVVAVERLPEKDL